ncbi:hypothetical protein KBY93_15850, partial [Synechococcus sp. J7-Johnson]|uniref:hypothetical protein n=1 Tax=Synechococcus sp. J7-Johnson TaxID=2823737 RepID=UPI0020CD9415
MKPTELLGLNRTKELVSLPHAEALPRRAVRRPDQHEPQIGTPEKERQPKPVLERQGMRYCGAHKSGYAVTGKSSHLGHGPLQAPPSMELSSRRLQSQAKRNTKKRHSSLRIFSAHITRKLIEIEPSAPADSLAMINFKEYLRLPVPKT